MSIANPQEQQGKFFWWGFIPFPKSWFAVEGNLPPGSPPYRDREPENLDDTWSRYNRQRRYEDNNGPSQQPKVQVPLGVIVTIMIYLVGQLVGGVWWAATLQSNLQHEITDRQKEESRLWDNIQTYRLEVQSLRVEMARRNTTSKSRSHEEE
jgi:PAS domain-containing protein